MRADIPRSALTLVTWFVPTGVQKGQWWTQGTGTALWTQEPDSIFECYRGGDPGALPRGGTGFCFLPCSLSWPTAPPLQRVVTLSLSLLRPPGAGAGVTGSPLSQVYGVLEMGLGAQWVLYPSAAAEVS